MTSRQIHKLEKAIENIEDSLQPDAVNVKILHTWLKVAGKYCNEVAEELKKD